MARYAAAIFLSAFLLFQVQPLAGKVILPWYGGSAAVWTTCLLFFQAVLFLGYLYAHLLGDRVASRRQGVAHAALLAISLLLLPLAASAAWRPPDQSIPVPRILAYLAATLGLPYFLLSANSPLLQRWYSLAGPHAPWRLYALSNLGSLLGLVSYPFLVEPLLPLGAQRALWAGLYVAFAAAVGACAAAVVRAAPALPARSSPAADAGPLDADERSRGRRALVLCLSMAGSLLMAATTHYLCQHVAVVPLLWILPLSLYLASFIVVFAGDRFYRRALLLPLLALASVGATATLFLGFTVGLLGRIAVLSGHLLVGCLVLHGELARLKPSPRRLTGYYLLLSAGGALGTAFVAFAAPALFSGYWEYHVAVAACWGLALVAALRSRAAADPVRSQRVWAAAAVSLFALVAALRWNTMTAMAQTVRAERNFYGALQVIERDAEDPRLHRYELTNGGILHGAQFTAPDLRRVPTVYFGQGSGLAMGLRAARAAAGGTAGPAPLRIGCVGLGVGVIAAHTEPGDVLRYYELNPVVETVARENFTFLADARGEVELSLGDARLSLERELASTGPQGFDVFIVDAFTGDAIPAHLLTRECLRLYLAHLRPGGRLLLHISNRYLDLRPLVAGLARDAGRAVLVVDSPGGENAALPATWATVAPSAAAFSSEEREAAARSRPLPPGREVLWTDEYSNLLGLLDRGR